MDATQSHLATATASAKTTSSVVAVRAPEFGVWKSFRTHWPEYGMEAALLGTFMISACAFGAIYEYPRSPIDAFDKLTNAKDAIKVFYEVDAFKDDEQGNAVIFS